MRSPPRSQSWEDYYSNQKTYIPPSRNGGRWNQFPIPSPTRGRSSPTREREASPARRTSTASLSQRDEKRNGAGARWNLFEGLTFYVQAREEESSREVGERVRLMERIKSHGGALSKKPNSTHVTTILIPLPASYPKNTVLLIDPSSSYRLPEVGRWTTRDVVQHLALVCFARASERNQDRQWEFRKRVLRMEWVEECLRAGRMEDDFGGWEVKATYDPKRVNDINTHRRSLDNAPVNPTSPYTPSLPPPPLPPIRLPQDPRKLLRKNADQPKSRDVNEQPNDSCQSGPTEDEPGGGPRRKDTWRPCEAISARDQMENDLQTGRSQFLEERDDGRTGQDDSEERTEEGAIGSGENEDDVIEREDVRPKGEGESSDETKEENNVPRDVVRGQANEQVNDKGDGAETKGTAKGTIVESDEEAKPDIKPVIEIETACSSDGITHSSNNDDNRRQGTLITNSLAPHPMTDSSVSSNSQGSTPSPAQSSAVRPQYVSRGTSPIPPQPTVRAPTRKVFARGVLPLTFCVLGSGREKRFAEILIKDNGGGILAASTYATIFVLPLSPTDSMHDHPELLDVVRGIELQPGRVAVSVDWIEGCVSQSTILPIEGYQMTTLGNGDRRMVTPPPSSTYASSESGSSGGGKRKGLEDEEHGGQKRSRA